MGGISLLELKEGKNHVKKMPVVDYDVLHITAPLTGKNNSRVANPAL
jgi:hypothetical protein